MRSVQMQYKLDHSCSPPRTPNYSFHNRNSSYSARGPFRHQVGMHLPSLVSIQPNTPPAACIHFGAYWFVRHFCALSRNNRNYPKSTLRTYPRPCILLSTNLDHYSHRRYNSSKTFWNRAVASFWFRFHSKSSHTVSLGLGLGPQSARLLNWLTKFKFPS